MSTESIGYGPELNANELESILDHVFDTSLNNEYKSRQEIKPGNSHVITRPTPICIWGTHGIGKTSLIKEYANKRNWKFRYCAPAQFEEMGDIHGLPVTYDPDPNIEGDEYTIYLPPEWVPKIEDVGPGILLLDDINRADDRILRGIMQLLQEFEMFSWKLPPNWLIVCTANPDCGDYSVTTMDDAMLTRLLHFTMKFDLNSWIEWASRSNIDNRGVAFVLTYPESIKGTRSTPRSLAQFFTQIKGIKDLKKDLEILSALAYSALDKTTAQSFISFVNDELSELINPEDILNSSSWNSMSKRLSDLISAGGDAKRLDRLSIICNRLLIHLKANKNQLDDKNKANIVNFLLDQSLPGDLRYSLHKDLVSIGGDVSQGIRRPDVAKKIMEVLEI